MTKPISIIGAGIAGLTLGRVLLHRGIPTILYEKASSKPRFNYSITLHATAYRPLRKILGFDDETFKRRVAVDAESGGNGKIGRGVDLPDHQCLYDTHSSFRANRNKLEQLLREGLDIRWEHTLQSIEPISPGTELRFQNGQACPAKVIVAADGVHSSVRKLLELPTKLDVLPYVVFNGKRKISRNTFEAVYGPAMREQNDIEEKHEDIVLNISINEKTEKDTSLNWIYSRPVRGGSDPLYQPNRSNEDAKKIPDELFQEVSALEGLSPPFSEVFQVQDMRNDRILHWLMRNTSVPLSELQSASETNGIYFMGDAIHAEPIVGGNGANAAILDALSLGEKIAGNEESNIADWYSERYEVWTKGVAQSQESIANMHLPSRNYSGNL